MSAPKLIIKNLSKDYLLSNNKTVTALKNFNLSVFPENLFLSSARAVAEKPLCLTLFPELKNKL